MKLRLYIDEDSMRRALVFALRARGADVVTAMETGMAGCADDVQLDYATAEGRALYSYNISDYCRLHAAYLTVGKPHGGIILAQQRQFSIGEQTQRLLRLIAARTADQMRSQLEFLSAWG